MSLSLRQVEKCFTINKGCETGSPVYCPHVVGFARGFCASCVIFANAMLVWLSCTYSELFLYVV